MGDIRLDLKNVTESALGFLGYYRYLFLCKTREKPQSSVLNLEITDCSHNLEIHVDSDTLQKGMCNAQVLGHSRRSNSHLREVSSL